MQIRAHGTFQAEDLARKANTQQVGQAEVRSDSEGLMKLVSYSSSADSVGSSRVERVSKPDIV
jgi:hypothetical protein